jgi:hypothetical protein
MTEVVDSQGRSARTPNDTHTTTGINMLQVMYFSIIFIIIPGIILAFFIIAALLPGLAVDHDAKLSGRAGFWAGLVLFAVYAVSAISKVTAPDFNAESLPSFSWLGLTVGVILGFALLYFVEFTLPSRGIGVLTLILCAASTIGIFSYLFNSGIRDFTMYLTLGALFGVLSNVIVNPSLARGILSARTGKS